MKDVVLLHGYLESKAIWKNIADGLEFNVITLDLLGHGMNKADNFSSITEMAFDVREKLKDLKIANYSVVGHSMGGYVALELFQKDSNCEEVVLLNSNFWEDSEEKKQDRLRVLDAVAHNKHRFVKEVIPNLFSDPNEFHQVIKSLVSAANKMSENSIKNSAIAMRNRSDKTFLVKSNAEKFLVLQGVEDTLTTANEMRARIPENVRLETIAGGHMGWCESTTNITSLLNEFFTS